MHFTSTCTTRKKRNKLNSKTQQSKCIPLEFYIRQCKQVSTQMEGLLFFFVQQILSYCFIYLIHFPSKPFPNRVPFRCPCAGTSVSCSVGCSGVGAMPELPSWPQGRFLLPQPRHQHRFAQRVVALPVHGATHSICDFCNRDKAAALHRVSKTRL